MTLQDKCNGSWLFWLGESFHSNCLHIYFCVKPLEPFRSSDQEKETLRLLVVFKTFSKRSYLTGRVAYLHTQTTPK